VTDELALREVFFGEGEGKNYVVLCNTALKDGSSKATPISSVFSDAHTEYRSAQFVIMDCEYQLPSGKSIIERFSLDAKKRPTIFVSGKIGPPKQISPKYLKSGTTLTNFLTATLEPHAAKVENSNDLKMKCLDRDWCGLLLKGGTPENYVKNMMKNLLTKYENIHFASVDSSSLYLSSLEEYLPEFKKNEHRFVLFKKVSGGLASGKDGKEAQSRLITSILPLEGKDISLNVIGDLIDSATSGYTQMKRLPSLPQVKIRSKKLEEQDNQRRQRAKRRENGSNDSQGKHDASANDGSKEGRRLEREKRREEHRKSNPNYRQRTPEEIAEIERQRRKRMQEEAEKWNILDADAPVEGGTSDIGYDEDEDEHLFDSIESDDVVVDDEDELFDLD
jgi:hypothetical protein